jgi:hypothetical protein
VDNSGAASLGSEIQIKLQNINNELQQKCIKMYEEKGNIVADDC